MALTEKLCGCIEDGKPCAKKSGLSMEGWICEEETGLRQKPLGQASAAEQPAQPPAGDVVERMLDAFMPGWRCEPSPERQRKNMTAALVVAREGMVSLDDVEKAVMAEMKDWACPPLDIHSTCKAVRASLAKPAERVDIRDRETGEYWVYLDGTLDFCGQSKQVAERYAAGLRQELKAGKQ